MKIYNNTHRAPAERRRQTFAGRPPPFPALLPAPFLAPYQRARKQPLVWYASPVYWGKMATGIVILRKE